MAAKTIIKRNLAPLREFQTDYRLPRRSYLYWAALIFVWLTEQLLSSRDWWPDIPWLGVLAFVGTFAAGQLFQDLTNPESWLRHNIRVWNRIGRFGVVKKNKEYFSLGDDHGGKLTYVATKIPFDFEKNVKIAAIRITGWRFGYGGNGIMGYINKYSWKYSEASNHLKGDSIEIPLAYIPEETGHPGVYGDKQLNGLLFSKNSAHLIQVEIICDSSTQTKELLVILPDDRMTWTGPEALNTGNRFLVFDKDETLFPKPPRN